MTSACLLQNYYFELLRNGLMNLIVLNVILVIGIVLMIVSIVRISLVTRRLKTSNEKRQRRLDFAYFGGMLGGRE